MEARARARAMVQMLGLHLHLQLRPHLRPLIVPSEWVPDMLVQCGRAVRPSVPAPPTSPGANPPRSPSNTLQFSPRARLHPPQKRSMRHRSSTRARPRVILLDARFPMRSLSGTGKSIEGAKRGVEVEGRREQCAIVIGRPGFRVPKFVESVDDWFDAPIFERHRRFALRDFAFSHRPLSTHEATSFQRNYGIRLLFIALAIAHYHTHTHPSIPDRTRTPPASSSRRTASATAPSSPPAAPHTPPPPPPSPAAPPAQTPASPV